MKLTNEQIIESIGNIKAVGSTHIDYKIYRNLQQAIELVDEIVIEIIKSSESKDRPEQSMNTIGQLAFNSLKELNESLTEQLKD